MSEELRPGNPLGWAQQDFNKALLAAQREFPTIGKGRTAKIETTKGSYSYKYADLGDILEAVMPILHKHGIALSQAPVSESGMVGVRTRLIHESGHVEDSGALLLHSGNNPQAAGSAMTYARRYSACAVLGIVADEDDDGRAASVPDSDYVEVPDFTDAIRTAVSEFVEWNEDEQKAKWVETAKELGIGKPKTLDDVDAVADAMREKYAAHLDSLT